MDKQIGFTSFFLPAEKAVPLNFRLEPNCLLELQAIGGGPIFIFAGSVDTNTCKSLLNEGSSTEPNYLLAAARGQASYRTVIQPDSVMTLFADVESIGHIRACVKGEKESPSYA